jgi:hypothetical protein
MATTTTASGAGGGWVGFAAILLIVAGTMQFLDGLWAIRTQDTAVDALFWNNNLEAWGWLYLLLGIGLIATGVFIFQRAAWAYGVGIFVGCIGAVLNIFWIFSYPLASVLLITLNLIVVYALTTYGVDDLQY